MVMVYGYGLVGLVWFKFNKPAQPLMVHFCVMMCDNDFTTVSIIMMFVSRYDSYHNSKSR